MKYLDCIELLELALQLLKNGRRDQVPVSKLTEVQTLIVGCRKRAVENPMLEARCDDILLGISAVQGGSSITYLPQSMRDVLLQGIQECLASVCSDAWDYYSVHDVPISNQTTPLLRTVVAYHYNVL